MAIPLHFGVVLKSVVGSSPDDIFPQETAGIVGSSFSDLQVAIGLLHEEDILTHNRFSHIERKDMWVQYQNYLDPDRPVPPEGYESDDANGSGVDGNKNAVGRFASTVTLAVASPVPTKVALVFAFPVPAKISLTDTMVVVPTTVAMKWRERTTQGVS
jgi:hypothetical protein